MLIFGVDYVDIVVGTFDLGVGCWWLYDTSRLAGSGRTVTTQTEFLDSVYVTKFGDSTTEIASVTD